MKTLLILSLVIGPTAFANDDDMIVSAQRVETVEVAEAPACAPPPSSTEIFAIPEVQIPPMALPGLTSDCRQLLLEHYDELLSEIHRDWKTFKAELNETNGSLLETDTRIAMARLEDLEKAMKRLSRKQNLSSFDERDLKRFCERVQKSLK